MGQQELRQLITPCSVRVVEMNEPFSLLSPSYSVQDPTPWDDVTHSVRVFPYMPRGLSLRQLQISSG